MAVFGFSLYCSTNESNVFLLNVSGSKSKKRSLLFRDLDSRFTSKHGVSFYTNRQNAQ